MPEKLTGKKGIMAYFRARVGQVVKGRELFEASGGQSEYTRRIREIRADYGWNIQTYRDSMDLKNDEYRLASPPPEGPPVRFQRGVSGRLRAQVLQRNGFTCQMCGRGPMDVDSRGRRVVLDAGHIVDKDSGGRDEMSNLRVLCSECNNGAKHLVSPPESQMWLMGKVRTANQDSQRAVYEWLRGKFGE